MQRDEICIIDQNDDRDSWFCVSGRTFLRRDAADKRYRYEVVLKPEKLEF